MAFKGLIRIALIADELTSHCLGFDASIRHITPLNYWWVLRVWKPDFLLVESVWRGQGESWKYKVAAYPDVPSRNNRALQRVVALARDLGIPTVFWNKEDGVHFDRFIASARLFDHIFTVDENCIPRYRAVVAPQVTVNTLMFPVQPAIHHPGEGGFKLRRACFVGSYSHHIHDRRREWQDMMFNACTDLGLTVFDRNSSRKSANYRYPDMPWLEIKPSVPHDATAQIYRDYMVSLNVNTITDSPTMYSRRLVEILACGGMAVTNPALSVERHFADFCTVVRSADECWELFGRLHRDGLSATDRERARAGADHVLQHHTWAHRLDEIMRIIS